MRVLVTGGAGYIGTELVAALARRSDIDEILVYDNLSRGSLNLFLFGSLEPGGDGARTRFVRGELLDSRAMGAALDGIDVVYHLAAKVTTPFADEDAHGFDQVNHWGTAELSYLLERHPVERLIYLSSTSVYGATREEAAPHTIPTPRTTYGLSKYQGERMLERLADRLALYVFRCGNVYGYSPAMRFDSVINRHLFDAHFARRITIHGSGEQHRAFVHVQNVVHVLEAALGGLPPDTYDLVERNLSILDVSRHIQDLYPDLERLFVNQDVALRDLRVEPDARLARHLDGRSFDDQLRAVRDRFRF
jgi:UDP-glucose 4-epimerase